MKEILEIKSIEKGWGDGSTYFTTDGDGSYSTYIDKIIAEERIVGKGYYNDLIITVYCSYLEEKRVFEIESNSSLTIIYKN